MKSYPTKFKSFLWKIVQMGTLQKLQNSIQIFWPVYLIHTNSLFWVIFVELPFCHIPPPNTSTRGKDSKIQLIFHLNILVFQTNGKQPYSFPVLSSFCNGLCFVSFESFLISGECIVSSNVSVWIQWCNRWILQNCTKVDFHNDIHVATWRHRFEKHSHVNIYTFCVQLISPGRKI